MRHSESWYIELAERLGHRGFVTLAEITKAEADPVVWGEVGTADPVFHLDIDCPEIASDDGVRGLYWSQVRERIALPRVCSTCCFATRGKLS